MILCRKEKTETKKVFWKRRFSASYTVEATYVLAITLLALSVLICSGYTKYKEETGIMRLHHMVEQVRGQEQKEDRSLSIGGWRAEVTSDADQTEGSLAGQGWRKHIEVKNHEPENMMRLTTIFQAGLHAPGASQ